MTPIRGPLGRLDRLRDELAKAWLVRLIERASLEEISDLPTDRFAREVPELIGGIVSAAASDGGDPYELSADQKKRAAALAELRGGRDAAPSDLARDVASLQAVMIRALRDEVADGDTGRFADAVERLLDAAAAIQAAAVEELVRGRSRELESQANTDPLTGLFNLRYLQRQLEHMLETHRRYGHPFALLLMDIDGLKRINDAHGHPAGDRVLMQLAMSLQRSIRTVDTGARLGGDEFCILAPQQDSQGGAALAERLGAAVEEEVATPESPPTSLSIGVAACPEHGDAADALIDAADRAMYRAKAAGERMAMADPAGAGVAEGARS